MEFFFGLKLSQNKRDVNILVQIQQSVNSLPFFCELFL